MRSHWDLIIVDEAHKMSAYSEDKKTPAYQLGESLSEMTDHFLLMTATPHKGDPKNFSLFLRLLDKDVYGDVKSLERAMEEREAPLYLRRVKEALVTFPYPDTGLAKSLFTRRNVKTIPFPIDDEELDFYDLLTRYVEDQSIKAAQSETVQGRASLYEVFKPQEARRLAERIEIHYTPKHGSWLNMAEIELSALNSQCLDRRIPTLATMQNYITAWENDRNNRQTKIRWHFSNVKARIKLKHLYPKLSM